MATLSAVRQALADTISAAVPDLHPYPTVPEVANLPAFVIVPRATNFDAAFGRGLDDHELDVIVMVSPRDAGLAQTDLDEYVAGSGAKSIRQAIFNASDLGLDETDARVVSMANYGGRWEVAEVNHIGASLLVRVSSPGNA